MGLGIDFGTCYSSAALMWGGQDRTPQAIKEPLKHGFSFPSSVFLIGQGEILVGQAAENSRKKDPQRYLREFKRDLGSSDPYMLGNCPMLPEELVAEVIHKLKIEADKATTGRGGTPLTNVVIPVPATYQSYKRKLMQEAGTKAGFSQVELLEEPVAAAIYYSHQARVEDGEIILVYDLGGGTFDASLIQKQSSGYQLLALPTGLANCGGTDFDREISKDLKKKCCETLRQQLEAKDGWLARALVQDLCRDLKHQLSEAEESTIYIPISLGQVEPYTLSRQAFNHMIAPLIDETIDCCDQLVRSAGIKWQQVNHILLVGGSCRIPYVKEAIEKELNQHPLLVDDPELAVCFGAAIDQAESATQEKQAVDILQSATEHVPKSSLEEAEVYFKQAGEEFQVGNNGGAVANCILGVCLTPSVPKSATSLETFHNYADYLKWFKRNSPAMKPFSEQEFYRSLRFEG